MALVVMDSVNVDEAGDPTAVLMASYGALEDNASYYVDDMCLDPSVCYAVTLLDQGGDSFLKTGSFRASVDGDMILSVGPIDAGTYHSGIGAYTWGAEFGNC